MSDPIKFLRQIAAVAGLLIAQCVLAQPESEPPTHASSATGVSRVEVPPGGREMHFRVVDADTGNPVDGVNVRTWVRGNLVTDDTGSCFFPLPTPKIGEVAGSGDFYYRINFAKDGYVPRFVSWSRSQNDRVESMPVEYTAKLERAAVIGGFVRNQAGEPVAGARVVFSGVNPAAAGQREKTTVAPSYHVERTDETGHWGCNHLPKDFLNMTFRVTHPDYLPTTFGCFGSQSGNPAVVAVPREDFLAGRAALVMGHGIELSGLVVDSGGKPVSGASITRNHEWRNTSALLETGDDGRFKLSNLRPGLMILTIQAKGLEPQTLTITNTEQMPELKLVMNPGKVLKGKVVDPTGRPIAGATVRMDRLDFKPLEFDWSVATDADGGFLWDSAPSDPHPYFISANGYNSHSEPELVADGQEKTIILRKSEDGKIFVDGRVIDGETKAPVEKFTVITREFKQDSSEEHAQVEVASKTGDYTATLGQEFASYVIEIRADGYLPQVSDRKSPGDGDRKIDFEVRKGEVLAGIVYLPDGKPASGAEVALCSEATRAVLGGGRLIEQFRTNVTVTGQDGTFAFAPIDGAQAICAAHQRGFVHLELDGAKPPFKLTLQPWGRIEGTARSGGQPVTNATIILEQPFAYMGLSLSFYDFFAKTDASGRFVFSNVPPIELRLSRTINNTAQNPQFVTMAPGQTTNVDSGGTGRQLNGKLVVRGFDGAINWQAGQEIQLSAKVVEPTMPALEDEAAQKKWLSHFWRSPEGKSFVRSQRMIIGKFDSEGAFTFDDVPSGEYQLVAQLRESAPQGGRRIGSAQKDIAVPEGVTGNDPGATNLGNIEILLAKNLRVGDAAPLFEVKTIEGRPLKLADFRGKYVLLDFWATWCGPCRGETPNLKATYDAYGKDPRFAMIGLSLDALAAAPMEYARENDCRWIDGFLGEWSKATVPNQYGVEGIPAIFLIDPDGKIAARDLRGDGIRQAVGKALGAN